MKSTCVTTECDFFPVTLAIYAPPGGPLLANVQVTSGPCVARSACYSGCETAYFAPGISSVPDGGATCGFVAVSTDGRSEAFAVTIVQDYGGATGMCCLLSPGRGYWVDLTPSVHFDPSEVVVVHFNRDAGVPDGGDAAEGGTSDSKMLETD